MCGVLLNPSRVMPQARDDFEGFLKAQEEKEVIVHVETSLSV